MLFFIWLLNILSNALWSSVPIDVSGSVPQLSTCPFRLHTALFTHFSIWWLFQSLMTINNALVKVLEESSFSTCVTLSIGQRPKSRLVRSKGFACLKSDQHCQDALYRGHSNFLIHLLRTGLLPLSAYTTRYLKIDLIAFAMGMLLCWESKYVFKNILTLFCISLVSICVLHTLANFPEFWVGYWFHLK